MDNHKNFAFSSILVAPSPAASGTTFDITAGHGNARFPAAPFNAFIFPDGQQPTVDNCEIVTVTNRTGDVFTVTRQAESSTARTIIVGDAIVAGITVKTITDLETSLTNKQPLDADLTTIAALNSALSGVLATDGAGWILKTYSALKTALALVKGDVGLGNVTNDAQAKADFSGYTGKTTPVDADTTIINDSAASGAVKSLTWANIKATLKTYFDGLYQAALGFTPENVANKDTDGTLAANSDTKYASQKATKTYADALKRPIPIMRLNLYRAAVTGNSATSTSVLAANSAYFHAFPVPKPGATTLTDILFDVTTGFAGNGRVGVFTITDGKDPANGVTLLADFGLVDLTSIAVKEVAGSQIINEEWVMIAFWTPSASPAFRAYNSTVNNGNAGYMFTGYHSGPLYNQARPRTGWFTTGVDYSAGFPSSIASLSAASGGANVMPLILARFSY